MPMVLLLLAYAFVSNVALAVVPHEPVVIWCGPRLGIWLTASVATVGTTAAAWVDHRVFVPLVRRLEAGRAAAFTARYPLGRYVAAIAVGRLPRYLLLAWLGFTIHIPAWLLVALFVLLIIPSVRMLLWPRQPAN